MLDRRDQARRSRGAWLSLACPCRLSPTRRHLVKQGAICETLFKTIRGFNLVFQIFLKIPSDTFKQYTPMVLDSVCAPVEQLAFTRMCTLHFSPSLQNKIVAWWSRVHWVHLRTKCSRVGADWRMTTGTKPISVWELCDNFVKLV